VAEGRSGKLAVTAKLIRARTIFRALRGNTKPVAGEHMAANEPRQIKGSRVGRWAFSPRDHDLTRAFLRLSRPGESETGLHTARFWTPGNTICDCRLTVEARFLTLESKPRAMLPRIADVECPMHRRRKLPGHSGSIGLTGSNLLMM
jgi:hypothetical protein